MAVDEYHGRLRVRRLDANRMPASNCWRCFLSGLDLAYPSPQILIASHIVNPAHLGLVMEKSR